MEAGRAMVLGDEAAVKRMLTSDAYHGNGVRMLRQFLSIQQSAASQVLRFERAVPPGDSRDDVWFSCGQSKL